MLKNTLSLRVWSEDMPDSRYFSDEFSDYISNSLLKLVNPGEGGSITRFNNGFKDKFTSKSLELGTSVHRFILEGESNSIGEIDKPKAKLGYVVDEVYKIRSNNPSVSIYDAIKAACVVKGYYASKVTDNIVKKVIREGFHYYNYMRTVNREQTIVLTAEDKVTVASCAESCKPLLIGGDEVYNEFAIFAEEINETVLDGITLKFKAKIDRWTVKHDEKKIVLFDLKTTSYPAVNFVSYEYYTISDDLRYVKATGLGSFFKYHYYRQLAFYGFLLKEYIKQNRPELADYEIEYYILVVETTGNNRAMLYNIDDKYISIGSQEADMLIQIIRDYHERQRYTLLQQS